MNFCPRKIYVFYTQFFQNVLLSRGFRGCRMPSKVQKFHSHGIGFVILAASSLDRRARNSQPHSCYAPSSLKMISCGLPYVTNPHETPCNLDHSGLIISAVLAQVAGLYTPRYRRHVSHCKPQLMMWRRWVGFYVLITSASST